MMTEEMGGVIGYWVHLLDFDLYNILQFFFSFIYNYAQLFIGGQTLHS